LDFLEIDSNEIDYQTEEDVYSHFNIVLLFMAVNKLDTDSKQYSIFI